MRTSGAALSRAGAILLSRPWSMGAELYAYAVTDCARVLFSIIMIQRPLDYRPAG